MKIPYSNQPTNQPTSQPANQPTNQPTGQATKQPSNQAASQPASQPTNQPTNRPTNQATKQPSSQSANQPTKQPGASSILSKRLDVGRGTRMCMSSMGWWVQEWPICGSQNEFISEPYIAYLEWYPSPEKWA